MGNENSGGWLGSARKTSVLECLRLTMSDMRGSGIVQGDTNQAVFSWKTGEAEEDVATVRAVVMSRSATWVVLCLAYTVQVDGVPQEIRETVQLVRAATDAGGQWWFKCPAEVDGQTCARQVGVLYLPPTQEFFGCKHCHDLAYAWSTGKKGSGGAKMDEMSEVADVDGQDGLDDGDVAVADSAGAALGEAPAEGPGGEPGPCTLRLRSFAYVDHAMRQLNPDNATLQEAGRMKLVDELLTKMVQDDGLPEERLSQAIPLVQSQAPAAFAAFATRILREGNFLVGPEHGQAYYPLHRMGKILRLHLVDDLQLERAGDLLLLDAAVEAFVQARILLGRATGLSSENGPLPGEEKLLRTQAVQQQKLFMAAMDKLTPKPVRRLGRPPAKESA